MNIKLTRLSRGAAAVFAISALGVGAAACGPNDPGQASSGTSASASSSAAAAGHGAGGSGSTSTSGGTSSASNSGAPQRCHTAEMTAGFGSDGGGVPDMHADQTTAAIWLKNTSGRTCTLYGFPGVDITNNLAPHSPWSLARSSKAPTKVTLKPGTHTTFTITLLPVRSGAAQADQVQPGALLITPPNEKQHFTLKWPYGGALVNQSEATHPGTYVNPIGAS
jgi:hypothetical protein